MMAFSCDTLERITIDALERTAFVLVDPCAPDATISPSHFARVRFSGPANGMVVVGASSGFLRELASSLLGICPEDIEVETEGLDALRELANILGGSVLHDLGGQQSEFSLGLPSLIDRDPDMGGISSWFACEGQCLTVSCYGLERSCVGRFT
ncbi:MAG: chemotaxis protein CheX [Phycisphaerales bacterium JB059]